MDAFDTHIVLDTDITDSIQGGGGLEGGGTGGGTSGGIGGVD